MTHTASADIETRWFKSTYSSNEGPNCVEVAATSRSVLVRDSKDTSRPHFAVPLSAWATFLGYANLDHANSERNVE